MVSLLSRLALSSRLTMYSTEWLLGTYSPLASDPEDELDSNISQPKSIRNKSRSNKRLVAVVCLLSLICLAAGFTSGTLLNSWTTNGSDSENTPVSACGRSQFRREWRSLSHREKHNYIQAVQCLKQTPSKLGLNQSLYDDFPYVHFRVGGYCTLFAILNHRYELM